MTTVETLTCTDLPPVKKPVTSVAPTFTVSPPLNGLKGIQLEANLSMERLIHAVLACCLLVELRRTGTFKGVSNQPLCTAGLSTVYRRHLCN